MQTTVETKENNNQPTSGLYYHTTVGDVDIKVKVVAVGEPGEAVSVFCTRAGHHQPWDVETALQAQEVIAAIKPHFSFTDYKFIPLHGHSSTGLKIHPIHATPGANGPSRTTLEMYERIKQLIETDAETRVFVSRRGKDGIAGSGKLTEHALRREIARIIRTGGHLDTKVDSIVRLVNAAH